MAWVFASGLDYDATPADVAAALGVYGPVTAVELLPWRSQPGRGGFFAQPRPHGGQGHVFTTLAAAERLIADAAQNRVRVRSRTVKLKFDNNPPRNVRSHEDKQLDPILTFEVHEFAVGSWEGGQAGSGETFVQTWRHPRAAGASLFFSTKLKSFAVTCKDVTEPEASVDTMMADLMRHILRSSAPSSTSEDLKLQFRLNDLAYDVPLVGVRGPGNCVHLYFTLQRPPRCYCARTGASVASDLTWSIDEMYLSTPADDAFDRMRWDRCCPRLFTSPKGGQQLGQHGLSGDGDVLRVTIKPRDQETWVTFLNHMADYDTVSGADVDRFLYLYPVSPRQAIAGESLSEALGQPGLKLNFECLFLVQSLLTWHILPEFFSGAADLCALLSALPPDDAVAVLRRWYDRNRPVPDPVSALDDALHDLAGALPSRAHAHLDRLLRVARVRVTPLHIYLMPRDQEMGNRVLRKFKDNLDHFVRLSFSEENFDRLYIEQDSVANRVRRVMETGLDVGGRHFEFLAYSQSQLKEQSCWFFAPISASLDCPKGWSCDQVRRWMGDFTAERCVGKCAARMGLCFSSTWAAGKDKLIADVSFGQVRDVTTEDGRYMFSDGCGMISAEQAAHLADRLGWPNPEPPSAFQIRFGGAKGMVSVWNHCDLPLVLRPSMLKFSSEHTYLEVNQPAVYLPAYLNRQLITLLGTLGVRDDTFLSLQAAAVAELNTSLGDAKAATRLLASVGHDRPAVSVEVRRLLAAGFPPTEPYIQSILLAVRALLIFDLRSRARIPVPEAVLLLGIMDESGALNPGEVFLQIDPLSLSADPLAARRVILGPVVVAKNPCLHPGDVRFLTAVDRPELRHLVNVVAFPKHGPRPHPTEMSGGDLDGDQYFVTWDPRLHPPPNGVARFGAVMGPQGYEPMDYTAPETKRVPEGQHVSIPMLIDFFVDYIQSDVLGQVANAHLALADESDLAALDPRCLKLAELHSLAVDFPKHGQVVKHPQELKYNTYPDFFDKRDGLRPTRRSERALGRLFRALASEGLEELQASLRRAVHRPAADNAFLAWPGVASFAGDSERVYAYYCDEMTALRNAFGSRGTTEGEVISGHVLKFHRLYRKGSRSKAEDARRALGDRVAALRRDVRAEFWRGLQLPDIDPRNDAAGGGEARASETRRSPADTARLAFASLPPAARAAVEAKAAAWYAVAYTPPADPHADVADSRWRRGGGWRRGRAHPPPRPAPLVSFPWIVYDVLAFMRPRPGRDTG